jgi:hypothetical protein
MANLYQKRCEEEIIICSVMCYCAENVFIASIRDCNRKESEIDLRLVMVQVGLKPPICRSQTAACQPACPSRCNPFLWDSKVDCVVINIRHRDSGSNRYAVRPHSVLFDSSGQGASK